MEASPTTVQNLSISKIKVGTPRFRQDLGDLSSFENSILTVGLLQPICVSEDLELIAGYRRLQACKLLGWSDIPVHIIALTDIRKGDPRILAVSISCPQNWIMLSNFQNDYSETEIYSNSNYPLQSSPFKSAFPV